MNFKFCYINSTLQNSDGIIKCHFIFVKKKDVLYSIIHNEENESHRNVAELDPNHNFFLLVDDGSSGSFGKEISFRAKFENELRKGRSSVHYENSSFMKRKNNECELSMLENIPENESDDDDNDISETVELKSGLKKGIIPMVLIGNFILILILAGFKTFV